MRSEWFFFELMKNITFNVFSCLLFDSETPFEPHLSCVCWLWDSIWLIVTLSLSHCFLSFFFSLYIYTYAYTYFIIYFLVLTKPVPAWIPVKACFSTSDTIVTLYRYRSTNRFVSLIIPSLGGWGAEIYLRNNLIFLLFFCFCPFQLYLTFGELTGANWVSVDFNVSYSSCWGYSLI